MKKNASKKLGFWMAASMVVGNMIGSGIFLLPSALAEYGGISLIGWLITSFGALILALCFGFISRLVPKTGGPYIYTRLSFGDAPAFFVGWGYWMAIMIGCAAVSIALVGYLTVFFPGLKSNSILSAGIALGVIWSVVMLNISGVRNSGRFQLITTVLKISALFVVILAALFYYDASNFSPFNASPESTGSAVRATAVLTFWAFLGLESASIIAENVENPAQNVPKVTILGTIAVAIIYMLSTTAVLAILPVLDLKNSAAPFADAARQSFGTWAYYVVAIGAIISCAGTLNGITLNCSQMPFALSRDKLFPAFLENVSKRGTVKNALIVSGLCVTVLLFLNYTQGLVNLFKNLIQLSTFAILLPYAMTALACLVLIIRKRSEYSTKESVFWMSVSSIALIYSLWAFTGPGWSIIVKGILLLLASLPIYLWFGVYQKKYKKESV